MSHLPNYLRRHRKRLALSQDDVAFLLGAHSGAKLSRYERFVRVPALETALALEVILRKPACELFSGLSRKVQRQIAGRAKALTYRMKRGKVTKHTQRKCEVLAAIINSLIKHE